MLKLLIAELKSLFRTWDELVGMDALKAGQAIVNEQTTMEYVLTGLPRYMASSELIT